MDQDATQTFLPKLWEKDQEEWHILMKWWKSLKQNTLSILVYMELITTRDLLEFMRPQVFINSHMEQETELLHSEFQHKWCMKMEEDTLKIEDQHQILIHILYHRLYSTLLVSNKQKPYKWLNTIKNGQSGFLMLEFQTSDTDYFADIYYLYAFKI